MDFWNAAHNIEEKYRDYLKTTFYFRDPEFRESFKESLAEGCLYKGPFLEAIPSFSKGKTLRILLRELGYTHIDEAFLSALLGDRPFHSHQEKAFRQALSNENYVVATGTGSGKTESFLYPILFHLYQEFLNGNLKEGVRAIILYPMNALANDQRSRIGHIEKVLDQMNSPFRFTFGQFTGETPNDKNDSTRNAKDHLDHRLPGEMVLRSEMRASPPHILLTNYSMLEYLLLRPDDSPLFDNGASRYFKFIVLDEVHQYNGSRGTEMAMLIRRLKQRLRDGGCKDRLQCIATSATLSDPSESSLAISKFVSVLFGEPFADRNIIITDRNKRCFPKYALEPNDYLLLEKVLYEADQISIEKVYKLYVEIKGEKPEFSDIPKIVGSILQHDKKTCSLLTMLEQSPKSIDELAEELFPESSAIEKIPLTNLLVQLLIKAKDPESEAALLSARYHFFLRSLEGAFISYYPKKRVFLDRKVTDQNGAVFEVALCRECGQHYIIGRIKKGNLEEAVHDQSQ
ncbi:MAG: DEAD/DEAH box helicase, partial [Rectinema sp.]